jgi:hypothetical protein
MQFSYYLRAPDGVKTSAQISSVISGPHQNGWLSQVSLDGQFLATLLNSGFDWLSGHNETPRSPQAFICHILI